MFELNVGYREQINKWCLLTLLYLNMSFKGNTHIHYITVQVHVVQSVYDIMILYGVYH